MVWSEQKDVKLLRAMTAEGVFVTNKRVSRERGVVWQNAASALFAESLTVNARAVRDRYQVLAKKWREKVRRQENESGGGDEQLTEVEILVEELVEMENESEKKSEQVDDGHKKAVTEEKKRATELRDRALERFSQTRKRHEYDESKNDEEKKEPKRRRSGGEVMEWLKEKGEYGRQLREQELQEKREEGEAQRVQNEQFTLQLQSQNEQMKMFQQQMLLQMQHQQQQQQQQFVTMQHQMMSMVQQQAQTMSHLLNKND